MRFHSLLVSAIMLMPFSMVADDLLKAIPFEQVTLEKDPALAHTMDSIIDLIGAAQKPDGYLYEAHTTGVSAQHEQWGGGGMGDRPYSWVVHSHELYNMGHMYEGAVAYYQATGKDKWLRIAEKSARHINHVFFEGDPAYNGGKPVMQAPGHEEIELALVKLYQATGDTLYLNMAKRFIDIRGITFKPEGEGVLAPLLRAAASARKRSAQGCGACRARRLPLLGHGRRDGPDGRHIAPTGSRQHLGQHRRHPHAHHRRTESFQPRPQIPGAMVRHCLLPVESGASHTADTGHDVCPHR